MTVLINCKDIFLEYLGAKVLSGVTLGVDEGDRIGIVGINGSGKSSLLKVLASLVQPDTGEVTLRSGTTVGMLSQSDDLSDADSVVSAVTGGLAEHEWASDRRIREIIDTLIGDIFGDTLVGSLSGGQRRRVDLARLLIGNWDVLMMDEPTNHLDMAAISWLAEHLKHRWPSGKGTLLLITHDRWFLDEVAENMWEVALGRVRAFEGGYSAYIQQRVEREMADERAEQRRQNLARKELAWLSRGAQARSTKPKFRVQAARELIADIPLPRNELELKRVAMQRLGKQVVDLIGVTKSYEKDESYNYEQSNCHLSDPSRHSREGGSPPSQQGIAIDSRLRGNDKSGSINGKTCAMEKQVIKKLDWIIGPGERIGILGANGEGKSTLLGLIDGSLIPTSGRVKIGASVRFGHLTQRLAELAPYEDETVYAVLKQCKGYYRVDGKDLSPARLLERLGFVRTQLQNRVCDLSGGQRRRLQLLITLLEEPNVLILDEPGNDLDTDMLAVMEDLLDNWPGTLLLVSHDRYLTERVTDNQYALIDGQLRHMPGGVEQYLKTIVEASAENDSKQVSQSTAPAPQEKPNQTAAQRHAARKQLASLERKMSTLQNKLTTLTAQMHDTDPSDYAELIRLGEEDKSLKQQLRDLEDEWLELSES